MDKSRFMKNHSATYASLQAHLKTIVVMLSNAHNETVQAQKRYTKGNLKRKAREAKKIAELERYVQDIHKRGDKIYKILSQLTVAPASPELEKVKKVRKPKAKA